MKILHKSYKKYRFNEGYKFDVKTGKAYTAEKKGEFKFSKSCKVFKIDKGNGKFRVIYSPNDYYKNWMKQYNKILMHKMLFLTGKNIFHAFLPNKNAVTNATMHIGYKYSLKIDLKDFFDNVTQEMVKEYGISSYCFIYGSPKQGLPTSPMIASLALIKPINKIINRLISYGTTKLTIYADDITISFNNREYFESIRDIVYEEIKAVGLKINYKKTKLMFGHKDNMRRIICGVGVGKHKVFPTRKTNRKIKSSKFKKENENVIEGIIEWSRCKVPNPAKQKYKLDKYKLYKEKQKA